MFPGDPAYGLYLYQSWAQAAAKLGPGGAGPMHPAAAAAWQAHLAQAVKVIITPTVPRIVTYLPWHAVLFWRHAKVC